MRKFPCSQRACRLGPSARAGAEAGRARIPAVGVRPVRAVPHIPAAPHLLGARAAGLLADPCGPWIAQSGAAAAHCAVTHSGAVYCTPAAPAAPVWAVRPCCLPPRLQLVGPKAPPPHTHGALAMLIPSYLIILSILGRDVGAAAAEQRILLHRIPGIPGYMGGCRLPGALRIRINDVSTFCAACCSARRLLQEKDMLCLHTERLQTNACARARARTRTHTHTHTHTHTIHTHTHLHTRIHTPTQTHTAHADPRPNCASAGAPRLGPRRGRHKDGAGAAVSPLQPG